MIDIIKTFLGRSLKDVIKLRKSLEEEENIYRYNKNKLKFESLLDDRGFKGIEFSEKDLRELNLIEWNIFGLINHSKLEIDIEDLIKYNKGFLSENLGYILLETSQIVFINKFQILLQIPKIKNEIGFILTSPECPEIYKINSDIIIDPIMNIFN